MKVSVIGASGKVGLELTRLLATQTVFFEHVEVVLYAKNNVHKVLGNLEDLKESSFLLGSPFSNNLKFVPSKEISDIQNSDLIIVCAGLFASAEEKEKYKSIDLTGRNIQSFKNSSLIRQLSSDVRKYSSHSDVVIVTNQSDMMSEQARQILPKGNVYGLGCYLDTIRFKKIFSELTHIPFESINATILGFHNKDMFLDERSFQVSCPVNNMSREIQKALDQTIMRGKEISDMQKDIHYPFLNSGSSKLPAAALFKLIECYTQKDKTLCIPLNRMLSDEEKEKFDVKVDYGAQLLCQITNHKINPVTTRLSLLDTNLLKQGLNNFAQSFNSFSITYNCFNALGRR